MALTRANVEGILIKRVGALMTAASMDGTTIDGTNTDLNDPIGQALMRLDYTPTDITLIVDADLSSVGTGDYAGLLDIAEWRVLESIAGNLALVDITVGPRSEKLSQLADQVTAMAANKRQQVEDEYGIGGASMTAGILTLDFMQKTSETET